MRQHLSGFSSNWSDILVSFILYTLTSTIWLHSAVSQAPSKCIIPFRTRHAFTVDVIMHAQNTNTNIQSICVYGFHRSSFALWYLSLVSLLFITLSIISICMSIHLLLTIQVDYTLVDVSDLHTLSIRRFEIGSRTLPNFGYRYCQIHC